MDEEKGIRIIDPKFIQTENGLKQGEMILKLRLL